MRNLIVLTDYDPQWPEIFRREAEGIRAALGSKTLCLEHVGSTSVHGLAAKPVIDIVLAVGNSADEAAWVPDLEAAGYTLRIREPDWFEHRMLKGPNTDINLHVFSDRCPEIERMLLFRNWLRSSEGDRKLYEQTKRALALRDWESVQDYADAKAGIVGEIMARAGGGR